MRIPERADAGGPPILVTVDGEAPITWTAFCEANADGFTPAELSAIAAHLERDEVYVAGGGAAPDVEIRLVALTVGMP